MASTGINGAPILILDLAEVLRLEHLLTESSEIQVNDPLFLKVLEFKADVVAMARRKEAAVPSIFPQSDWKAEALAKCLQRPETD